MRTQFFVDDLVIDDDFDIISSEATVLEAAIKMKEGGIPDLVVVDENDRALGVIADYDIVTRTVAGRKSAESTSVEESMYRIKSVYKNTSVEVAFARMQELNVSAVPVVDSNDKLLGIVTISDCWGYIPEKYEDYKGLLTVTNARFSNYWFTIFMVILYFFFGVLFPLMGITGFLKSELIISSTFTPFVTYGLFDVKGGEYFSRYLDFSSNGIAWLSITLFSILFVFIGIVVSFIIIQWAYSDYHLIRQKKTRETLGIILGLLNTVGIWIIFALVLSMGLVNNLNTTIDQSGIISSLLSLLFLFLAVSRDFLFKENEIRNG